MGPPQRKKVGQGLSLERFAGAKRSGYSKQQRVQREFALNAKKVNRAGPAPDGEDESAAADEDGDMVGAPSDDEADCDLRGGFAALNPPQRLAVQGFAGSKRQAAAGARQGVRQKVRPSGHAADPGSLAISSKGFEQPAAGAGAAASAGPAAERDARTGEVTEPKEAAWEPGRHARAPAGGAARKGAPTEGGGHVRRHKPLSRLQRIEAEVQAHKAAAAAEREEARRAAEAHRARVAAAQAQRKAQAALLRKRTRRGQPVMRFRVDKVLVQLQAEVGAG